MILVQSVCLFVRPQDNWKSCERILTKFPGRAVHGPGTKWLNFGVDPDHCQDPGVRSPKSGFTGLSKKYLVDSDQSCIANLHCKNYSAILCWRSAEVCALWVLLVTSLSDFAQKIWLMFTVCLTERLLETLSWVSVKFVGSVNLNWFDLAVEFFVWFFLLAYFAIIIISQTSSPKQ